VTDEVTQWADGRLPRLLGDRRIGEGLVAIGAVAFAVVCVFLATVPPADGYETSLVDAYPPAFWSAFAVVLVAAVLLFAGATVTGDRRWRAGFAFIAANYGVFFFLPAHRGYHLYDRGSADALGHLGMVRQALETGTLPDVFYPFEHALIAELSMTGLSLSVGRYLFSFVFTLLFITSVAALLRRLTGTERAIGAGLLAAAPLVFTNFQVRIHPAIFSFLFVPLVLVVLERLRRTRHRRDLGVFLLLGTAIVFFHPMTTVLVTLLLATSVLLQRGYGRLRTGVRTISPRLAIVLVPTAAVWYTGFTRTQRAVREVGLALLNSGGSNIAADQIQRTGAIEFTTLQLATRLFQKYGVVLLIAALGGVFVLMVAVRLSRRKSSYAETLVAGQFLIGVGVTLLFLVVYLIAFDPIRVSRYMIVAAVLAVGLLAHRAAAEDVQLGNRSVGSTVLTLVIVVVIVAVLLGTFLGTTYWANMHMTHAEYHGTEFVLDNHDRSLNIHSHDLTVKMQWYVYGERNHYFPHPIGPSYRVPDRLGYGDGRTAIETFGSAYVVTHDRDTRYYRDDYFFEQQQDLLFVYGESDVQRMRRDPTVDRVYANGGFEGWLVGNGTG
jgi:hypothetical protein